MIEKVLKEAESKMTRALEAMRREFGTIRTGRASASLVEWLKVDYYGTPTPLVQLASITVPESRLLIIQPWDPGSIPAIEKAVTSSNLGLNPVNDGKIIRIAIPPLTDERRQELVRMVGKMAEDFKVEIRNFRREAKDGLEELEKEKTISEDELHRSLKQVQDITDRFVKEIDQVLEAKEKEIREV